MRIMLTNEKIVTVTVQWLNGYEKFSRNGEKIWIGIRQNQGL